MGSPQVINCTVSTVDGVKSSSVIISWMRPEGDIIMNDTRITINPTTSSDNTYTSSLQFTYLMEGDEGMYTCNVMILNTSGSESVELQSLTGKLCTFINGCLYRYKTVIMSISCDVATVNLLLLLFC